MKCGHCSAELVPVPGVGHVHPDGQVAAHREDEHGRLVVDHVARPWTPERTK